MIAARLPAVGAGEGGISGAVRAVAIRSIDPLNDARAKLMVQMLTDGAPAKVAATLQEQAATRDAWRRAALATVLGSQSAVGQGVSGDWRVR